MIAASGPVGGTPVQRLFALPLNAVTFEEASQFAADAVAAEIPRHVLFVNAAKVVMARDDRRLRDALERADLVAVDGQPVVWASKLLGRSVPARVPGIDYMNEVLRLANRFRWRVFFLGSTEAVLGEVERHCRSNLPGVVLAGHHHGYFDTDRDREIADLVEAARAEVLFVAMPSPRKEYWLSDYGRRSGAFLAVAVGGSYEVLVGRVKRAPDSWQRAGLEWLWRTLQEPRRLGPRYLQTNSRFLAMVAIEYLRDHRRSVR